jgi:hypothetical protein
LLAAKLFTRYEITTKPFDSYNTAPNTISIGCLMAANFSTSDSELIDLDSSSLDGPQTAVDKKLTCMNVKQPLK